MLNIGDEVTIVSADQLQSCDDEMAFIYCNDDMKKYAGCAAKIVSTCGECRYLLDVDNKTWYWTERWLIPCSEPFEAQSSAAVDKLFN